MTGIICNQARYCTFYKTVYGTNNFNNAVINLDGEKFYCDVISSFFKSVIGGPARLVEKSIDALVVENILECIVLERINKKHGSQKP